MRDERHYEGVMSLVQMAVACAMQEAGMQTLHISRESLATAFDRLDVRFSNGIADGMRFEVQPKRIEPTDEAPSLTSTSYKPSEAEQARLWRDLCERTFGPGAHFAANIEANMQQVVALHWESQPLTPEELNALEFCVFSATHGGRTDNARLALAHRAAKKLRTVAETEVPADQATTVRDYALAIADSPAPTPSFLAIPTVVDCAYCHGEGHLVKGSRKLECPDCKGTGTVPAEESPA